MAAYRESGGRPSEGEEGEGNDFQKRREMAGVRRGMSLNSQGIYIAIIIFQKL
jgi:hypothetical protein